MKVQTKWKRYLFLFLLIGIPLALFFGIKRNLPWHKIFVVQAKHNIVDLAFSPDGRMLASASAQQMTTKRSEDQPVHFSGGVIQLWDARNGKLLRTIALGNLPIFQVAFLHDNATLVTANYRDIRFWDVKTGKLKRILKTQGKQFAISNDGNYLATAYRQQLETKKHRNFHRITVRVWDVKTGIRAHQFSTSRMDFALLTGSVHCAFRADNSRILITTDITNHFNEWNVKTGKVVTNIEDLGVAISTTQNGRKAIGIHYPAEDPTGIFQELCLFDAKSWKSIRTLDTAVQDAIFVDHGRTIVAAMYGELKFWNVANEKLVRTDKTIKGTTLATTIDERMFAHSGQNFIEFWSR